MFLPWFLNCLCSVQQLVEIKLNRAGQTPCLSSITIACFWIIHKKMFWYVKVTSEKQLWLGNSQQWARMHSQSVISTVSMVLRGLAMHGCVVLSSPEYPFSENCYLLGALGPSGGKSELNPIVFHSCLGCGASLHVTVCNLHLVCCAGSQLQRTSLVFDGACQVCSLLRWIQALGGKFPIWIQENFWPWSFVLPMKRQYD